MRTTSNRFAMALTLILTVFCAGFTVAAQEPSNEEAERVGLAEELVNRLLGAEDQLEARLDRLLEQGLTEAGGETGSEIETWIEPMKPLILETYLKNRRSAIAIYARQLTLAELERAVEFYSTPTGRKLVEAQEAIEIDAMQRGFLAGESGGPAPAVEEPEDRTVQAQTVADLRNVGTAMMSWLTDQVSGDATPVDLGEGKGTPLWVVLKEGAEPSSYTPISHARLKKLLVPTYIQAIPEQDGWGHPYEFFLSDDLLAAHVMAIRSPGRDGQFDTGPYAVGAFGPEDYDQDLVWVDGYFVRWPERRE